MYFYVFEDLSMHKSIKCASAIQIEMAGFACQRRQRFVQFVFSCFLVQTCCHLGKQQQNYSAFIIVFVLVFELRVISTLIL